MFGYRENLRCETQEKYGYYCSYCRGKGKEPVPYYEFSDYHSKGWSIKNIFDQTAQQRKGN